jgi:RHS repeat-associated protein
LWCNTYNAEGQRVRKTNVTQGTCAAPAQSNSWDFLYDLSAHEIAMISGTGVWDRGEVYVGGRRVATYNNGTTYFIHTDQLGTDRVRTTISGSVYQACNNLPFGDNFSCPGSDATPMHFTGKNHLYESGLDDFGARYLADTMGRFMTPDLMGGHQEDPQTLNKYSYVRNNPLNLTDPTGLDLYLQGCGNDTNTCKDNFVGTTNDKGKFTRTTIQSDENGDFDGHDVSFNSTGIHIDDKYQGVYAPGTDATRVNGDEDSGFSGTHFVVNSNCLGTCLAGGALYSDTKDTNVFKGVIAVLEGPNKRFDALGGHPGQQYRGGNHNGPDAHLSYVLDGQGNPTNGMPFHIDKRNPFHSVGGILVHGGDLTEYEFKAKILGQQPPPLPADIRPRDNQ